jgi:Flp pilus assembly protein TadD
MTTPKGENEIVPKMPLKLILTITVVAIAGLPAWGGDTLKITLPRRSELTPVQKLNRQGVEAVKKHDYDQASTIFYKAYLFDPADPFTLNNLGYVSELQGQLERAHKFYTLAAEQGSNANIDQSNTKTLVGKPMRAAFNNLEDNSMRVNRMNVDAMSTLAQGRGYEAVAQLEKALAIDPKNPFTLNNLGVAYETIGDFPNALRYYDAAYDTHSKEAVVVTEDRTWRGKPVSNLAAASAVRLGQRINRMDTSESQAIKFTMRGVAATNQNDLQAAKEDFLHAYALDPTSAFSLNNRGYVAELDGDLETAEFFYEKARKAGDANAAIGSATQASAAGRRLSEVATDSDTQVDSELERYTQERRQQTGVIELTPRANQAPGQQAPH